MFLQEEISLCSTWALDTTDRHFRISTLVSDRFNTADLSGYQVQCSFNTLPEQIREILPSAY